MSVVVQFRGGTQRGAQGSVVITCAYEDQPRELHGSHAQVAEQALELAVVPIDRELLTSKLRAALGASRELAAPLVERLLEAHVLSEVVPASDRVHVLGEDALARQIRLALAHHHFPAQLSGVQLISLGSAGSEGYFARVAAARALPSPALSVCIDTQGAFIGPLAGATAAPCPECLWARLCARKPAHYSPAAVGLPDTTLLPALIPQLLKAAELLARGRWQAASVWHMLPDAQVHRSLLPQPGCRLCGDAPASNGLEELAARFSERWERLLSAADGGEPDAARSAAWLDPVLGPIRREEYARPGLYRDLPLVVGSLRMLQPGATEFRRQSLSSISFGPGNTLEKRRLLALSEGIERYAVMMERPDVLDKRRSELPGPALLPNEMVRYSAEQYATGVASEYDDQPIDWSFAQEWTHGRLALAPHDVFAIRRICAPGTFRVLDEPFASGSAAHRTTALALQRALLELIERDALLLAWYLRLPLREFEFHAGDPSTREMYEHLRAAGIELRCFDLRVDFDLPCLLALARATRDHGPWRAGGHIISATAGTSWTDALRHCLQELIGHYSVFGVISPAGDKHLEPGTGDERPQWAAFARYLSPHANQPFSFLGGSPAEPLPDAQLDCEVLEYLRRELIARQLPAYVRPLGDRDVLSSGIVPLRAFVPGLLRLTASRETVNFGEARITRLRDKWRAFEPLNPMPHPLS